MDDWKSLGTYHGRLAKVDYLELELLDFMQCKRVDQRIEVDLSYPRGITVDLAEKTLRWMSLRGSPRYELKKICVHFSEIEHWDYVYDDTFLQMIISTGDSRYGFHTWCDYTDLDLAYCLAVACGIPFRYDYTEQPGVTRVKRGSLLTPEALRSVQEVFFSEARLDGEVITVPIYQQSPLQFDLGARRVRGPIDLSFDEVRSCLLDLKVREGDDKTHYLYYLSLNGAAFMERAKQYNNDMRASNDDCATLQARLGAIPMLCGWPSQASFPVPTDPRAALQQRSRGVAPTSPEDKVLAQGCGLLLLSLLGFLFKRK